MLRPAIAWTILCVLGGIQLAGFAQTTTQGRTPPMTYHAPSEASDPGKVELSLERLYRLEPALAPASASRPAGTQGETRPERDEVKRARFVDMLKEHMRFGDSRAAVVVSTSPLVVAAYSDELDCVVMLKFPERLVKENKLKEGDRLLTVNTYPRRKTADYKAEDVELGPKQLKRYGNVFPIIADFLTDDQKRLDARKAAITDEEWRRCRRMAEEYQKAHPKQMRDGTPLRSMIAAKERD